MVAFAAFSLISTPLCGLPLEITDAFNLSVNALGGMILTRTLARLARARGISVVFHHHYYWHYADYNPAVEAMGEAGGRDAWHVTNCEEMSKRMQLLYPSIKRAAAFSNIGAVRPNLVE